MNPDKKSLSKPLASVSLDLDDLWTYLKTHGDPQWSTYPSYLQYAVPRILDFLQEEQSRITFFIVAQDAAFEQNSEVLAEISKCGHEIANHTFHHDPWLHIYSIEEIDREIAMAEEHIERVTGKVPKGFRGPGFSFSSNVLQVLINRGYQYDASTFPNILNPLARMYFLWTSDMSKEERKKRKGLFGSWKDGLRPNRPFKWEAGNGELVELPVTTMPIFKIPFHASYILYLSTYSFSLAMTYLKVAITLCKLTRTQPSILLHPLDFIGSDDTDLLSFFPAMRIKSSSKIRVMKALFRHLSANFELVTTFEHAQHIDRLTKVSRKQVILPSI